MARYDEALSQAVALHQAGHFVAAEAAYRALLATGGDDPNLIHLLGVVSGQLGRPAEAVGLIRQAIARDATNPQFFQNLAASYERMGRAHEAAEAYNELGKLLQKLGNFVAAAEAYEVALRLVPGAAGALNNLATALLRQGRHDEAIAILERAIAASPEAAEGYNNLGYALHGVGRLVEATEAYRQALARNPSFPEALSNLGNARQHLGDLEGAIANYRAALALNPDFAAGHWNLSHALLSKGEFEAGWREYEWRWRWDDFTELRRNFTQPYWQGEPPAALDGPLLVITEQGFGDTIQFCRLVPQLAARGYRLIFEVERALYPLIWMNFGRYGIKVVPRTDSPRVVEGEPRFAAYVSLMSLPLRLGLTLASVPAKVPYLEAEPGRVEAWRRRLGPGFHVGLAWAGRPGHIGDRVRSIAPERLAPLFRVAGVKFWSIQRGAAEAKLAAAGLAATELGEELVDFGETAAAITALDLVIAVDTAVSHLAGALGRPGWVMLPHVADWRWLVERTDSPWYPTLTLYRQKIPGNWDEVIARAAADLAARART